MRILELNQIQTFCFLSVDVLHSDNFVTAFEGRGAVLQGQRVLDLEVGNMGLFLAFGGFSSLCVGELL